VCCDRSDLVLVLLLSQAVGEEEGVLEEIALADAQLQETRRF
jgi:hypothetical protein